MPLLKPHIAESTSSRLTEINFFSIFLYSPKIMLEKMSDPQFLQAKPEDAPELTRICKIAFDDLSLRTLGNVEGGPPGYDSVEYQLERIGSTPYLKIVLYEKLIGGIILYKKENGHILLGRIWITPAQRNKGIGTKALQHLEKSFPTKKRSLETPTYAKGNHHFYEKMGYIKKGIVPDIPEPLYLYEKIMV